jgi:mono/diheme cytochrome c family protein
MVHMALNARLTPAEEDAVTEFLMSVARPVAEAPAGRSTTVALSEPGRLPDLVSTDPDMAKYLVPSDSLIGVEAYKRQCVVCHGAEGEGDGPAAAALKPRPTDLTESELVSEMPDAELLESECRGVRPRTHSGAELNSNLATMRKPRFGGASFISGEQRRSWGALIPRLR